MLLKVISGAQIGADIAGLRAAHACDLETGGWMPLGWRTKTGSLSAEDILRFSLQETEDAGYPERTRRNVRDSDATLQFAYNWSSPGERLTSRLIREYGKPSFQINLFIDHNGRFKTDLFDAATWIKQENIRILNIAGNGDAAIEFCVESYLVSVFRELQS